MTQLSYIPIAFNKFIEQAFVYIFRIHIICYRFNICSNVAVADDFRKGSMVGCLACVSFGSLLHSNALPAWRNATNKTEISANGFLMRKSFEQRGFHLQRDERFARFVDFGRRVWDILLVIRGFLMRTYNPQRDDF